MNRPATPVPHRPPGGDDDQADIVIAAIQEVLELVPLTPEQQAQIERRLKERFGDQVVRVRKRLQLVDQDKDRRAAVYQDGLTAMSNQEIVTKHGISRATLYRWMKQGPPTPGGRT